MLLRKQHVQPCPPTHHHRLMGQWTRCGLSVCINSVRLDAMKENEQKKRMSVCSCCFFSPTSGHFMCLATGSNGYRRSVLAIQGRVSRARALADISAARFSWFWCVGRAVMLPVPTQRFNLHTSWKANCYFFIINDDWKMAPHWLQ